jgi:hypothetical protein
MKGNLSRWCRRTFATSSWHVDADPQLRGSRGTGKSLAIGLNFRGARSDTYTSEPLSVGRRKVCAKSNIVLLDKGIGRWRRSIALIGGALIDVFSRAIYWH